MRGFKLILTPPVTSGGGAIARRPDGRQSEKHRIKGGGAIVCGLLLTCVYGCRVHVISCVFLYPIMHPRGKNPSQNCAVGKRLKVSYGSRAQGHPGPQVVIERRAARGKHLGKAAVELDQ